MDSCPRPGVKGQYPCLGHSRGSGEVELVAGLDVEHEVAPIEVLHDEKEVFL